MFAEKSYPALQPLALCCPRQAQNKKAEQTTSCEHQLLTVPRLTIATLEHRAHSRLRCKVLKSGWLKLLKVRSRRLRRLIPRAMVVMRLAASNLSTVD